MKGATAYKSQGVGKGIERIQVHLVDGGAGERFDLDACTQSLVFANVRRKYAGKNLYSRESSSCSAATTDASAGSTWWRQRKDESEVGGLHAM